MSSFKNSEHIGVLAVPLSIEGVGPMVYFLQPPRLMAPGY